MHHGALVTRHNLFHQYSNPLLNFIDHPRGFLPLRTIEKLCVQRIKLYHLLSKSSLSQESDEFLVSRLKNEFPNVYTVCCCRERHLRALKACHYDRIARFIMLHVAAKNKLKRNIFNMVVNNEIILYGLHFQNVSVEVQEEFLVNEKLIKPLDTIDDDEEINYEVSWRYVASLIAKRNIRLIKGRAYIRRCHFVEVAKSFQLEKIISSLTKFKIGLSILGMDPRINDIINNAEVNIDRCVKSLYQHKWLHKIDKNLARKSIDEASRNFPPCMEKMYWNFKNYSHLPYNARVQFIPFLKDIGVPLDSVAHLFRIRFLKNMSKEQYKKKRYNYEIRYVFGLEGSRKEQFTRQCSNIIAATNRTIQTCSGCPLLSEDGIETIFSLPSYSRYTINDKNHILSLLENVPTEKLCSEILKLNTGINKTDYIANPIQYYDLKTTNTR